MPPKKRFNSQIAVPIETAVKDKLYQAAQAAGLNVADIVRKAIEIYLSNENVKGN